MILVKDEGIILERTELGFESDGVLNPACIEKDGVVHMFYRAVRRSDRRSSVGYCQLVNNKVIKRFDHPVLSPEYSYEKKGIEDPRIVLIDGVYYLTYSGYDGENVLAYYATTNKLPHFKKQGLLGPKIKLKEIKKIFEHSKLECGENYLSYQKTYINNLQADDVIWIKNAMLFPKKIDNKFALLHRMLPGIHITYFDDFKDLTPSFWQHYFKNIDDYKIMYPKYKFESHHIAGGCPPIETKAGWLLIYHSVDNKKYHTCAALLDLDDPTKVIGRLSYPLFSPKEAWEKKGIVKNIVFPTGAVVNDNKLYIYYGAADKLIAAKSINLSELLDELKKEKNEN